MSLESKKISVIIPSHNSELHIRNCLLSVIKTNYPFLEIIVVDDVSSDESPKIVEELCHQYPQVIRLIRHKTNTGPAKARNTGAMNATGKYLFFMDSDTEMLTDTLDNFSRRIAEADAVTGIYDRIPINTGIAQRYKALLNYYFFSRKGVIEYEVFDSSRAGIRTEVFKELGGFKDNLVWGEDYENEEFGYRLCKKYKNLLDPLVRVRHIFADIKKMTRTYFHRVSLWMAIFMKRKKFESAGVTTLETAVSIVSLGFTLVTLPLAVINPFFCFISLVFLLIYLYDIIDFYIFVVREARLFILVAIVLNFYFSFVIWLGAFWGLIKVFTGMANIQIEEREISAYRY